MILTSKATGARAGRARLGQALVFALPAVWAVAVLALPLLGPGGIDVSPLLVAAPALACAAGGRPRHVVFGGLCALPALLPQAGGRDGLASKAAALVAILALVAAGWLISARRHRLLRELAQIRRIAAASQAALLRPLPRTVGTAAVAGDYLSATRGAQVGGDLYEVLATPYGVRAVIGDVRGHGITAIGTVAALLGSFREAAHDEPELGGVLRRLDRALLRHLQERAAVRSGAAPAEEEFATVLLLELGPDGGLSVLNCGHPWPYRIVVGPGPGAWSAPLNRGEPLPPLGLLGAGDADRPPVHRTRLLPGQALFAHTDGAEDARDPAGAFFPLPEALDHAARAAVRGGAFCPATLVEGFRAQLLRHVRGRLTDDVATLALYHERPRVPARPCPPPVPAAGPGGPAPTARQAQ